MNKSKPGYLYLPTAGHPQGAATLAYSNIQQLQSQAQQFITLGLAPTTRSTYSAGWKRFTSFCAEFGLLSTPASEHTLLLFVTSLAVSNLSYGTIKVYLSAVRHIHVLSGFHTDLNNQFTPPPPPPPGFSLHQLESKEVKQLHPPSEHDYPSPSK